VAETNYEVERFGKPTWRRLVRDHMEGKTLLYGWPRQYEESTQSMEEAPPTTLH